MAYDVARVRGLHTSLGDGWVHFDAQQGMLLPDSVATTVSTAFRGSMTTSVGPHPSARRSAAVLAAARLAIADLVGADPNGVVLGADPILLADADPDARLWLRSIVGGQFGVDEVETGDAALHRIAAGQRKIFTAGVTASAASRITVAHTPDQ